MSQLHHAYQRPQSASQHSSEVTNRSPSESWNGLNWSYGTFSSEDPKEENNPSFFQGKALNLEPGATFHVGSEEKMDNLRSPVPKWTSWPAIRDAVSAANLSSTVSSS